MTAPVAADWGDTTVVAHGSLRFEVSVAGDDAAETVVLLHGFPQDRSAWAGVVPALLTGGLRVVAPDQRGYSPAASPLDVSDYRIDHLVDDVLHLLDSFGLDSAHLVGHDWGAIVAWFTAARHPSRVRSLTAVSLPHPAAFGRALAKDAEQREASAYMKLFRSDDAERVLLDDGSRRLRAWFPEDVPAEIVDRYLARVAERTALSSRLAWYRAMERDFQNLGAVSVPTTYVWGDADFAVRERAASWCGDHVTSDYRLVVLQGVGHWIPEMAHDRLATEILRRTTAGAP